VQRVVFTAPILSGAPHPQAPRQGDRNAVIRGREHSLGQAVCSSWLKGGVWAYHSNSISSPSLSVLPALMLVFTFMTHSPYMVVGASGLSPDSFLAWTACSAACVVSEGDVLPLQFALFSV
jgi:hypothetical protein